MHCTFNEITINLMDYQQIVKMKRTSFLINTARGPIIYREALSAALKNKIIKGVALNFYEIKQPSLDILSSLNYNNILFNPHNVSISFECLKRLSILSAQNIINPLLLSKYDNCINLNQELIIKFEEKNLFAS
uniref:hypothetical protein n=1 Tax=Anunuuluaehu liula TaxID=3049639 RepID=UPI00300392CF